LIAPAATQPQIAATAGAFSTCWFSGMKLLMPMAGVRIGPNQAGTERAGSPMGDVVPDDGVICPTATRPL